MKGLILAAGKGSRLSSISRYMPKCLIKIGPYAIIDYQIKALRANGVQEIVVVIGFMAKKISDYLSKNYPDAKFKFICSPDYKSTNAGYSFWLAQRSIVGDDIIYLNGDLFCSDAVITDIIKCGSNNAASLKRCRMGDEEVKITTKKKGIIDSIGKRINPAVADGEFVGIAKFDRQTVKLLIKSAGDLIKRGGRRIFFADAMHHAVSFHGVKIRALDIKNKPAIDIDFPEDLKEAKKYIKRGEIVK